MERDADVIVVGGGLNGPALALALAQAGLSVTVIDAQKAAARTEAAFDGRAYALAIASKRLLQAVGVWNRITGGIQPILRIKASDGRPGEGPAPFFLDFDAAEIEEGPMGFMVEDRHLYAALLEAMAEMPGLTHVPGAEVVAQQVGEAGASVTLTDGRVLTGAMIAGCDGRQSGVARRAGIRRVGHDYGQTALVCAVEHELPHHGVAHQFFMPAGPLAILPLTGNRSSIVWSERTETADAIAALDDAAFLEVLRPRFGDFLGPIRLAGGRFRYPLNLTLAERYADARLALVGDAAHGVHPIAGQGLNLGFRDVAALAEVVVEAARRGEDIGAANVLARYQEWRRFDSTALALGMDGVNALFSNDNPVLRGVRDLGMAIVGAMPGLRRAFIRQAAGIAGTPPKLLRGQSI